MSAIVKINYIHNNPDGKDTKQNLNDEWVLLENKGDESINIVGWKLTDWRPNQQHIHVYTFPTRVDGYTWTLDPGELIFLMTGSGNDTFIAGDSTHLPQFHLYWNKSWYVWNNTGDTACLYDDGGNLVSQLHVP